MRTDVGLIEYVDDGIVFLRWLGTTRSRTDALWSRAKIRKPTVCAVTGKPIRVGDYAYRPVGNQDYRSARISVDLVARLIELAELRSRE